MNQSIEFDKDQLAVGKAMMENLRIVLVNIRNVIENNLNQAKNSALDYHIDLTEHFSDFSQIDSAIESLQKEIDIACNLAEQEAALVESYSNGEFDADFILKQYGHSVEEYVAAQAISYVAYAYPDQSGRILATAEMAGFKFGEGFVAFFEGLADGVISIAGAACTFVGNDKTAESLKDLTDFKFAVSLFENNDVFERINRNSYFDKDSAFAQSFYAMGETTGSTLTAAGVGKLLHNADLGKKVLSSAKTGLSAVKDYNGNYLDFRKAGFDSVDAYSCSIMFTAANQLLGVGAQKLGETGALKLSNVTGFSDAVSSATVAYDNSYVGSLLGNIGLDGKKVVGGFVKDTSSEMVSTFNDTKNQVGEAIVSSIDTSDLSERNQAVFNATTKIIKNAGNTVVKTTINKSSKQSKSNGA